MRKRAFTSVSLPDPSPTPQAPFPPVLFGLFVQRSSSAPRAVGSVRVWLPHGLELLLPWPSLLAALVLGHWPCCLVSSPQPPWWDDPAGDVSKTRLCGNSDCVWFGPHFPGWGPARSFSLPQAREAVAALAGLPTAGLTSASPSAPEVSHGYASPHSSQGSCGSPLTPDQ